MSRGAMWVFQGERIYIRDRLAVVEIKKEQDMPKWRVSNPGTKTKGPESPENERKAWDKRLVGQLTWSLRASQQSKTWEASPEETIVTLARTDHLARPRRR